MLTKEEVLTEIKAGRESQCIDGRDFTRLANFLTVDELGVIGYELKPGAEEQWETLEWTEENILKQLESDVAFGFEKALDQRGISAGLMFEVVKMWLWILDDELQYSNEYAYYGLPLFKAVAVKYNFTNEIGDYDGSEEKYNE